MFIDSFRYRLDTSSLQDPYIHIDSYDINVHNEQEFLNDVDATANMKTTTDEPKTASEDLKSAGVFEHEGLRMYVFSDVDILPAHVGYDSSIQYLLRRVDENGGDSATLWKNVQNAALMAVSSAEQNMYKEYNELLIQNRYLLYSVL
jgi:hypothetical protein